MAVYAYICRACDHRVARHTLTAESETVTGPYGCPCGCTIQQDQPSFGVDRDQYERLYAQADAALGA